MEQFFIYYDLVIISLGPIAVFSMLTNFIEEKRIAGRDSTRS